MADGYDLKIEGFKELEQLLYSLESGETIDNIQRKALRAAGAVIKPALIAATPVRTTVPSGKRALPAGALKAKVRTVVRIPHDGSAPSVTVDHGKLNYIANFVDKGHVNVRGGRSRVATSGPNAGKRSGKGKVVEGRSHTPAHPFIRAVESETHEEAVDAYLSTLEAGIDAVLKGAK